MASSADRSEYVMTGLILRRVTPDRGSGSYHSSPKNYTGCGPATGSWRRPTSARAAGPLISRWVMRKQLRQQQKNKLGDEKHLQYLQVLGTEEDAMPHKGPYQQLDDWADERPTADKAPGYMAKKDHLRSKSAGEPQLTREEFEALPVAIQRKFFSTLERLRFAQDSGCIDGIFRHYDAISIQNLKTRRNSRFVDRVVSDHYPARNRRRSLRDSQSRRRLPFGGSTNLPTKAYECSTQEAYARDEEVDLAKRLRASVILDAADEAIHKTGRRASQFQFLNSLDLTPSLATTGLGSERHSMDSHSTRGRSTKALSPAPPLISDSFYDSFRWLEEDDDLDLTLALDDCHANIRESLPSPTSNQRPSFRRRISINKIPFSQGSLSTSRPATSKATAAQTSPPCPARMDGSTTMPTSFLYGRRRSRGLSLNTVGSRTSNQESAMSMDSSTTHYQDPEARLRLRVCLASPQNFDEAVEFGFPSSDNLSSVATASPCLPELTGISPLSQYQGQPELSHDSGMRTFLDDDNEVDMMCDDLSLATGSDEPSVADPDSPRTPQNYEYANSAQLSGTMLGSEPRPLPRALTTESNFSRPSHTARQLSEGSSAGHAHAPASRRAMTLRMTLTRPDLRADEEQMYGWQQAPAGMNGRRLLNTASGVPESTVGGTVAYIGHDGPGTSYNAKENIDRVFAGLDQPAENRGMKRFWNLVKRG